MSPSLAIALVFAGGRRVVLPAGDDGQLLAGASPDAGSVARTRDERASHRLRHAAVRAAHHGRHRGNVWRALGRHDNGHIRPHLRRHDPACFPGAADAPHRARCERRMGWPTRRRAALERRSRYRRCGILGWERGGWRASAHCCWRASGWRRACLFGRLTFSLRSAPTPRCASRLIVVPLAAVAQQPLHALARFPASAGRCTRVSARGR